MIRITINGKPEELDAPLPLPELVRHYTGRDDLDGIAVGVNREVVERDAWGRHTVEEGDEVEIIAPFAGG